MNHAILLSGGVGSRLGLDTPKQYLRVAGRMVVTYALRSLLENSHVDAVWIVADTKYREDILTDAEAVGHSTEKIKGFSDPGETRQSSILNGLEAICDGSSVSEKDTVLIHDAARPLLSQDLINACYEALDGRFAEMDMPLCGQRLVERARSDLALPRSIEPAGWAGHEQVLPCSIGHDGVLPVLPMKDTVYLGSIGGRLESLLDRGKVLAGQAPELFNLKKYVAANRSLTQEQLAGIHGSTEPAVMAGMDIVTIPGDERNFKITTVSDLERFKSIVEGEDASRYQFGVQRFETS